MPMHSRSFSNDCEPSGVPLQPRRTRRGTMNSTTTAAGASQHASGNAAILDRYTDHDDARDDTFRHRSMSLSRDDDDDIIMPLNGDRDAESQRPLAPSGPPKPASQVTWMSLPRKDQLFILFVGRLFDFLQVASLQAYVFYQLKDINRDASDSEISQQAGLLQGCFTGAQVCTAILWGKAADARWCGRKWVLVIGFGGTAISCLGYGFATTFFWAAFWRAFGGAINGTVGIIRTMVAEITVEKKYQSRAFLILPMSFNVASILGPIMGGMLAEPVKTLPGIFGEHSFLGFQLFRDYPFALPSLINAFLLSIATTVCFLFLEETSKERRGKFDPGLHLANRIKRMIFRGKHHDTDGYARVGAAWAEDVQMDTFEDKPATKKPVAKRVLPFTRLWTRNVIFTLITGAFYDFQLGAFTNIWSLFLSTPRYMEQAAPPPPADGQAAAPAQFKRKLPLLFTGGLGMPASTVGIATSFLGILGMILQVFMYPPVQARLGTIRSFRYFLFLFPFAYFFAPYLAVTPSATPAPEPASGPLIWFVIIFVLLLQVTARTFTLPASIILLNNSSPHPSVLGTIHGLGQSVSAGFRTVGPVVGGWWYGYGLDIGMVAWGWWGVSIMSAVGCLTALGMHEGTGHEIFLEGEREEMD